MVLNKGKYLAMFQGREDVLFPNYVKDILSVFKQNDVQNGLLDL